MAEETNARQLLVGGPRALADLVPNLQEAGAGERELYSAGANGAGGAR